MNLIKNMLNKKQEEVLVQPTQEELENAIYSIKDLYVASLTQWLPIQEQQNDKIIVKRVNYDWYMDIATGKYYQECRFIDRAEHDVTYISNKVPFEYIYYNELKAKHVSNFATLPLKYLMDVIQDKDLSL